MIHHIRKKVNLVQKMNSNNQGNTMSVLPSNNMATTDVLKSKHFSTGAKSKNES